MTPEHAPSSGPAGGGQGMSRLSPAAMPVADAARVLTRLGGKPVTEAMLRADIDAGAAAYQALFGRAPSWRNRGDGAALVLFTLDNTTLELMAPDGEGEAADPP